MPNVTTRFISSTVPQTVGAGSFVTDTINVPGSYTATVVSIEAFVDVDPPDEGSGPDPTLTTIYLYNPTIGPNILHDGGAGSISGVTYDVSAISLTGMTIFNGSVMAGNWVLWVFNLFASNTATLNDWYLDITYFVVPQSPRFPNDPAAITIPAGQKYGKGVLKKNVKLNFNVSAPTVSSIFDSLRMCTFNANIEGVVVSAKSTGTGSTSLLSLHKVSGAVDTVLISQQIKIPAGNGYYYRYFPSLLKQLDNDDLSYTKTINQGDFLYFSIEQLGTNVTDINASVILNSRD